MTFPFTIPINYEYGYAEVFANRDAEQTTDCLVKEQEVEKQLVEVDVVSKVGFCTEYSLVSEFLYRNHETDDEQKFQRLCDVLTFYSERDLLWRSMP